MARCLVVNVKAEQGESPVYVKECNELQDFYDAIKAEPFDIAVCNVGGRNFDFFVDDEGLFEDNPIPSVMDAHFKALLVGNVVIANHDNEGNTTDLSDDDIRLIMANIEWLGIKQAGSDDFRLVPVIVNADYPVYERR